MPSTFLKSAALILLALSTAACGHRTLRIDLVPSTDFIAGRTIEQDPGFFVHDKIAIVNVSGLLSNSKSGGLLAQGSNPVSDLRETLHAIADDASVKAVILRLNTPGGTVTASDMMYRDVLAFKAATHKPVIAMMTDVCASGGFYLSSATDYRIAYPTTITGSIGVIVETVNFTGSLQKLGISTEAIASGPNKDVGNPFRPITDNDRKFFRGFVDQFYAQFTGIVKSTHPKVDPTNWPMLTDGRVVSGKDAVTFGLIDETGDMDTAINKAKEMAHVTKAKIQLFNRSDDPAGSVYAKAPAAQQFNALNLNLDAAEPLLHPQFLYLWMGQ